jgi:hypothetical protein
MSRAWVTDCSSCVEAGHVPAVVGRECRVRYLEAQLQLFPHALVVALGSKARYRLRGWPNLQTAFSVAPPGCNRQAARPSWDAVAAIVRALP